MSRVRTNSSARPLSGCAALTVRGSDCSSAAKRRAGRDGRARTPARRRRRRASASNAAWLSNEKLAGSAMSGGATPSSTLRRTAFGNWRWYSSATRVPYDAPTRSMRSAPSSRRTASRSCTAIEVVNRPQVALARRCRAASAAAPCTATARRYWRSGSACSASDSCSASGHTSGAEPPVPRWSTKTMSRRLLSRLKSAIVDAATAIALWPGPPARRNTGSGNLRRAIAGTTT